MTEKHSPERKCLVTGESYDKSELLRFVRAPDGTLTFDVNYKLPGRGAYVMPVAEHVKTAIKKNLFAKSFKNQIKIPSDMVGQVLSQIRHSALQYLALARRAGQAAAGTEKSAEYGRRHGLAAAVQASDAGPDSQKTVRHLAGDQPIVTEFTRDELGVIFGRDEAVVIALGHGGLAKQFLSAIERLQALKGLENP